VTITAHKPAWRDAGALPWLFDPHPGLRSEGAGRESQF